MPYSWAELFQMISRYRRELISANIVAIFGALVSVPIPLLIPLLVDEVLLEQPGASVAFMQSIFPLSWHGPTLYLSSILALTLILRFFTLIFNVWQTKEFTNISKDMIFRIRRDLLLRLQRISMSDYETLGSSTVASHLVTDLDDIDKLRIKNYKKYFL